MNKNMTTKWILLAVLLAPVASWSATGKITKVKGKSAIVEFNTPVKAGDLVQTADDLGPVGDTDPNSTTVTYGTGGTPATRKYAFAYSWNTSSTTVSGTSTTTHQGNVTWWFNFKQFELAPIVTFFNSGSSTTNFGLGGIAQYDIIQNKVGTVFVPGVYGKAVFASNSTPGASSSSTTLGVGAAVDWFPFVEHAALNAAVEYDMLSNSANSTTATQIQLYSGVKVYF